MSLIELLKVIVAQSELHVKWLNSLSMMENTGARKIAAAEHKTKVTLIMLKHAAEEARHAYYLKKQLSKIDSEACPNYSYEYLLAPISSHAYLNKLDIEVCKYIQKELLLSGAELKHAAYLLVTYAIEVRADELYPVYQECLDEVESKVNVKSIILEEEGHLQEMMIQLQEFSPKWEQHAVFACKIEQKLFDGWMKEVEKEVIGTLVH